MGLFRADYDRAGSGVSKNAPKKKRFALFFEIYFRKFSKFIGLNALTFLFCIPIITIGPAIAGMTKVLKSYAIEKNAFMFHDFWKGFSKNLKQSLPIGILDTVITISAVLAMNVYPAMYAQTGSIGYMILCVISMSFAFTLFMMNFYIFPMIVSMNLRLGEILRNSFLLTCGRFKTNIITFLISALLITAFVISSMINPMFAFLLPIWPISFVGFIIVFNSYPNIQKYVINPYYEQRGEENPEYDYLKPVSAVDGVFTDRGGAEKPIEGKKRSGRNKTIS